MKIVDNVKEIRNIVKKAILIEKKYKEDDEMKTSINNTAEYYYSIYEQNYGYTKDTFLKQNGFKWQPSMTSTDMFEDDTGYYHKTLCFAYLRNNEEMGE